jgi:hypothetical protein
LAEEEAAMNQYKVFSFLFYDSMNFHSNPKIFHSRKSDRLPTPTIPSFHRRPHHPATSSISLGPPIKALHHSSSKQTRSTISCSWEILSRTCLERHPLNSKHRRKLPAING